jgi:predicted amidohydrolase
MNLSVIQMNSSVDRDANVDKACALVDTAVERDGADLVVLPEFFNNFYFAQYRDYAHIDLAEPDDGPTMERVRERAQSHSIHVLATIFEEEAAGLYYDTAILVGPDGELLGKYRKAQPAAVQSLEKLFFRHGSHFPVFQIGEWRVGAIVCYDTLFPESARCVALNGAELILVPFAAPQQLLWRDIMRTRALENGVYFAPCNKVGTEGVGTPDDWRFGGQSMVVDPLGEVLVELDDEQEGVITTTLERERVFAARRRYPMFRDRRPDLYGPICAATEDIPRPAEQPLHARV